MQSIQMTFFFCSMYHTYNAQLFDWTKQFVICAIHTKKNCTEIRWSTTTTTTKNGTNEQYRKQDAMPSQYFYYFCHHAQYELWVCNNNNNKSGQKWQKEGNEQGRKGRERERGTSKFALSDLEYANSLAYYCCCFVRFFCSLHWCLIGLLSFFLCQYHFWTKHKYGTK